MQLGKKVTLGFLRVSLMGLGGFLFFAAKDADDVRAFAIVKMAWGLIILWIGIGGSLMYVFRNRVRDAVRAIPLDWRVKFVLFATALALLEEAITVLMTNLAPLFGAVHGTVGITAGTNYFDVVMFHSVIVFIPMFIAWAVVLSRYEFKPFSVFLLFGIMGIVAEASLVGPVVALIGFAQWIFVYGLMIYLPAYSIPEDRGARPVSLRHYLAVIPVVFLITLPMLIPIVLIISQVLHHPPLHL